MHNKSKSPTFEEQLVLESTVRFLDDSDEIEDSEILVENPYGFM